MASVPLRVLDINNFYSPVGGGIRVYHREKMRWCRENGVQCALVYPAGKDSVSDFEGGTMYAVKSPPLARSGYHFFVRGGPLREIIASYKPDVVELGSGIVVPGMVRESLRGIRSFGFYHSNWPVALPLSVLDITGGPIPRWFRRFAVPWMGRAYRGLDAVMGASETSLAVLREGGVKSTRKTPLGAHPGVFTPDARSEELRRELGVGPGGKLLLYMGRLAPEKGIHVLLETCPLLFREPGTVVVVAGRGHWRNRVLRAESRFGGRLRLLPYASQGGRGAVLMASADAFMSMGPCDTFSLVTLEALCCGTPVAACREAAAAELVEGAGGGSVYGPWNDPPALRDAVGKALEEAPAKKAGFRRFAERFTWDACFRRIFAVYGEDFCAGQAQR